MKFNHKCRNFPTQTILIYVNEKATTMFFLFRILTTLVEQQAHFCRQCHSKRLNLIVEILPMQIANQK